MGSIAPYLDPALWVRSFHSSVDDFTGATFWLGVPQIALINVLLSGDTAVVIAMACRELPPRQRPWGMAIGAGTAAVLLIIFALIIAPLLQFPYVKLIGGFALIYVAIKLLRPQAPGQDAVEAATHVWRVARIVALADVILGMDNMIAVAAVAKGNVALLAIGVAISIPIVLAGAALIMALLDRFPVLVWVGAALLGWVAGDMIATDQVVFAHVIAVFGDRFAHQSATAAGAAGMAFVIATGVLLWRR